MTRESKTRTIKTIKSTTKKLVDAAYKEVLDSLSKGSIEESLWKLAATESMQGSKAKALLSLEYVANVGETYISKSSKPLVCLCLPVFSYLKDTHILSHCLEIGREAFKYAKLLIEYEEAQQQLLSLDEDLED